MLAPETILDSILEAYVEVDRDLRIQHMNANAERLLRVTRGEALGKRFDEAVRDAARAHQWPQLVEAISAGRRLDLAVFYPSQYVWHDVKIVPVDRGGAGLFMRDVTDRQWLIRREAERTYLRNVFELAPVAITLTRGTKHVVEYVNAMSRQLTGGRPLEGKPIRDALPDIEQKELFDIIDQVYETGKEYVGRDILVRFDRNGDGVIEDGWFDVTYLPARDFDGKISGVLSISIDVTDRTRKRE